MGDVREAVLKLLGLSVDVDEGRTRPTEAPIGRDFMQVFMSLPEPIIQVLEEINSRIEKLNEEKEQAVAEQNFAKAASLRDKADKIKHRLLKAVEELRALLREPGDESE
jgi:ATP-dependent Clp protease ATP-binding subunit ClpC